MKHSITNMRWPIVASGALLAWLGCAALPAAAQGPSGHDGWERCFGISMAGQNDGMASGPDELVPGSSQSDYQGTAWVLVPQGECETTETPNGRGSLTPFDS